MFSVGLDEFQNLILYSQLIVAKIENDKSFISNEAKEIIFGSLLGDAKLELPPPSRDLPGRLLNALLALLTP